jgi:protein translocase SecG subunit
MHPIMIVLYIIIIAILIAIIGITLALNTKSEGLGAAITGASDSYRGAVGVEEQKRRLLQTLCYTFIVISFATAVINNYL